MTQEMPKSRAVVLRFEKIKRGAMALLTLAALLILVVDSKEISQGILLGIKLSATSIIPSLFPFFIFADLLTSVYQSDGSTFGSRAFEWFFGIRGCASTAFVLGTVCGFPLGVRCAAELYHDGAISREECERLITFVNNPSLAFVISAVGIGMYGSLRLGLLLYLSVIISAAAVGIINRKKIAKSKETVINSRQNFDLVASIKNAGISSVTISSYIIFFSALICAISPMVNNEYFLPLISSLLEVGNAAKTISGSAALRGVGAITLTGFALGFSGFSVHMQALSFLPKEVKKIRYFTAKFLQGILCGLISFLLFSLIYK